MSSRCARALLAAQSLAVASLGTGCLTPPAVLRAAHVDIQAALDAYPSGTETVEYEIEPGVALRGVFVPSDEGAPLVLHLLEASGTAAAKRLGFHELTGQLSDLGFASLVIDYRGVGLSDGERSPDNLVEDARLMWSAAIERAGAADRVWLRATSLGTLAAAALWRDGTRPAGTVLLLPVRAETATERFAREFKGPVWAWGARLLYRDIVEVDIVRELAQAPTPCLVVTSPDDTFLSEGERESLRSAARDTGAEWVERGGDHFEIAVEARALLPQELPFWITAGNPAADERMRAWLARLQGESARRFEAAEPRARLLALARYRRRGPAGRVAAAALANDDPFDAARLLWLLDRRPYRTAGSSGIAQLGFDEWIEMLRIDDGSGALSVELLEQASRPLDLTRRVGGMTMIPSLRSITEIARNWRPGEESYYVTYGIQLGNGIRGEASFSADAWLARLHAQGTPLVEIRRSCAQLLLKTHRIPERTRLGENGERVSEAYYDGEWQRLYFDP